jgi:hypothetical protein
MLDHEGSTTYFTVQKTLQQLPRKRKLQKVFLFTNFKTNYDNVDQASKIINPERLRSNSVNYDNVDQVSKTTNPERLWSNSSHHDKEESLNEDANRYKIVGLCGQLDQGKGMMTEDHVYQKANREEYK